MFKDLGHEQVGATEVLENYQRVIALVINVGYNARTNQIDIRHHFIREIVMNDTISVKYIKIKDQVADMLSKALGTNILKLLCKSSRVKIEITSQ